MIRNLKALGLALMAICAMSAFVAASANAATFTASAYPSTGTGEQKTKNVFTVQGQKVECTGAHFEGSLTAASHDITITPKYTGCTAFGFASATVKTTGCTYTFTIDNGGLEPNSVHVLCGSGTITVEAPAVSPSCIVHIPSQTPTVNKVSYANSEGGVLVTSEVEGVHSTTTKLGFLCPLKAEETDTSGKYTGSVLFKGLGGVTADIG